MTKATVPVRPVAHVDLGLTASVVVCAYSTERWSQLVRAITSARSQTLSPNEVLVVIDHNDALLRKAQQLATGAGVSVRVMSNAHTRGLSGARNTAIEFATGDVVAFLDDDASADASWLERLVEALSVPGTLAVSGWASPADPSSAPAWWPPEYDWVVGCSHVGLPADGGPVRNVIGCSMAFRREVFEQVGMFADDVGRVGNSAAGCEETELCIRIAAHAGGQPVQLVPSARVLHDVDPARFTWSYFKRRCVAEGRSKARVRRSVGSAALTSESAYVARVLPKALAGALGDAARGRRGSAARAAVIVAGVALAAYGYGTEVLEESLR